MRYLFLLILLLFSCGKEHSGVISETGNGGTVSGTIQGDTSAIGVTVSIRSANFRALDSTGLFSKSTTTNAQGDFSIGNIPPGRYLLEATDGNSNFYAHYFMVSKSDSLISLPAGTLQSAQEVNGTVKAGSATEVEVMGLRATAAVSAEGAFTISNLPQSELLLRFSKESNAQVLPSSLLGSAVEVSETPVLLLEDFEDGDDRHLLYPYRSLGQWYPHSMQTFTTVPSTIMDDFSSAITTTNSWDGKSVALSITANAESNLKAVPQIGIELGTGATGYPPETQWHDLSSMEELTFMARGSGLLRIGFITKKIWEEYTGADVFQDSVQLSDEWTKITIDADLLGPPSGSDAAEDGITWNQVNKQVAEITFFTTQDIEFALDDITLVGVRVNDFLDAEFKQ